MSTYTAEAVVLATGAAVPGMVAELGVTLPDASPIALLVATEPVPHELTAVLNTPRASLRPRPDGGLSVDADWASASGHPRTPTAATGWPTASSRSCWPKPPGCWPAIPRWRPPGAASGRSRSPATASRCSAGSTTFHGLYVAFTHSGATLGLIAGELLAYEIGQGAAHPMLADFNARRFG